MLGKTRRTIATYVRLEDWSGGYDLRWFNCSARCAYILSPSRMLGKVHITGSSCWEPQKCMCLLSTVSGLGM